ncbi:flavin reductase family protein [Paenibacillus sp. ACRRY]|uniref:flavin reductase family protein n=1 Tax=Paenibacillus sp. ACRRY TaxID=2918208 RepID=UPI001EF54F5A|nr:flavin reductase family protein [Paenibacillus sp. ACRRY]MCG7385176.1 flavin reductase family protein [Paenibacillus sp. ACRRY]
MNFENAKKRSAEEVVTDQHKTINPSILYYGTPVLLLSTLNEDGSTNLSPLSSSWALGDCLVLGLGIQGKAYENLKRHPECVINLPDASMWRAVESLGRYTGTYPVPEEKRQMGYEFCSEKFEAAGLTAQDSLRVKPLRIAECPLQIEASVQHMRTPEHTPFMAVVEVKSLEVHAHKKLISGLNKIDPAKWNPLIYNFRHYYGLGERQGENFRAE